MHSEIVHSVTEMVDHGKENFVMTVTDKRNGKTYEFTKFLAVGIDESGLINRGVIFGSHTAFDVADLVTITSKYISSVMDEMDSKTRMMIVDNIELNLSNDELD